MNEMTPSSLSTVALRCRDVLLHPVRVWDTIATEPGDLKDVFYPYAVILGLIPAIMMVIAGTAMNSAITRVGTMGWSMAVYAGGLLFTLTVGALMRILAPLFGARKSLVHACRVLIYASTPVLIAGILGLIPFLGILLTFLAMPWALVLFYLGIGRVMDTRGARQVLFTLTTVVLTFALGTIPMMITSSKTRRELPAQIAAAQARVPAEDTQATDDMVMRAMSGQGSEEDMHATADIQINQMKMMGGLKDSDIPALREELMQDMRKTNAQMAKKSQ
jgi:hypothetical protein